MIPSIEEIQSAYNLLVAGIDDSAHEDDDQGNRAYGGAVRAAKGLLVEGLAQKLVMIAWHELGGDPERLTFVKKAVRIPLRGGYLGRVRPAQVADYIRAHLPRYFYDIKTDVHVSIDQRLVLGIECKAYAENAMMKRILVDFTLLRQAAPGLKCALVQLESQLTGDYCQPLNPVVYGSPSTHTLLSYFDVDLHIVTLLEGERRIDRPIHKHGFFKPLKAEALRRAVEALKLLLAEYT